MILCRQANFIALYGTSYSIQSNINYFIRIFLYLLLFSNFQTKLIHLSEPSSDCDTQQECNYDMI